MIFHELIEILWYVLFDRLPLIIILDCGIVAILYLLFRRDDKEE